MGSGVTGINDYYSDSAFAEQQEVWLDRFYKEHFHRINDVERVRDDKRQLLGIDVVLHFEGGATANLDEKIRRKKYDDFFLEEYSNVKTKKPGWIIADGKITDYIVYAFADVREVYLLPYMLLRQAWFDNFFEWQATYDRKEAVNIERYKTSGLIVPIREVYRAIWKQCKFELQIFSHLDNKMT